MELNGKIIRKKMTSIEMCELAARFATAICTETTTIAEALMVTSHIQLVIQAHAFKEPVAAAK